MARLAKAHRAIGLAARRPHDFTIQYPVRRELFKDYYCAPRHVKMPDLIREKFESGDSDEYLLYCHVPFCEAKCYYCNFAVDTRKLPGLHEAYVNALCAELARLDDRVPDSASLRGIDIGGGTPTLLSSPLLEQLLRALEPWVERAEVDMPLSIETTPHVAAHERSKLEVLRDGGVRRVSVGLQSTNNETLASVNRSAQVDLGSAAILNLKDVGFDRVSVDLIFGLPEQTAEHWQTDLQNVVDLRPDAITTYDCLYRGKGRVFTRKTPEYPSWETYGRLYDQAFEFLQSAGYHAPYGSVNFCRHEGETGTSRYFEGRLLDGLDYIGVGNYASSMVGKHWAFAPYSVDAWMHELSQGETLPVGDIYRLPIAERAAKYLLLSLSFGFIDPARFHKFAGVPLDSMFAPSLEVALGQGWLVARGQKYCVAPGCFRFMPELRSLFYSEEALGWLEERLLDAR